MPFSDCCADAFDRVVRLRGRRCFQEKRVTVTAHQPHRVHARIRGYQDTLHRVILDSSYADEGDIVVCCTCPPYETTKPCKHIWATMLAVDRHNLLHRNDIYGRLQVTCAEPDSAVFSDPSDRESQSHKHRTESENRPEPGWRAHLASVGHHTKKLLGGRPHTSTPIIGQQREIWYVLNVGASLEQGHLQIEFFQRSPRDDGRFGKLKSLRVDENNLNEVPSASDRQLLHLLLRNDLDRDSDKYSHSYYSRYHHSTKRTRVRLATEMVDVLLPRLCVCPRFVWVLDSDQPADQDGKRVAWDDGPAWRLRLKIAGDDRHQHWNVSGQLHRDTEVVPLSEPILLLAHGVVLFQDRLAHLDVEQDFAWIAFLRQAETVRVPYEDRDDLIQYLWQLPSLPEIDLPENLRLQPVRVTPRGRLSVRPEPNRWGTTRLYADVSFLYDDQTVSHAAQQSGILDSKNQRVMLRDHDRERELTGQLASMGIHTVNNRRYDASGDVEFSKKRLPEIVAHLVRSGWVVEAEGHRIRSAGNYSLRVKSDVDWFELDGQFDFDGVSAKLPDLLAAVRRGDKFIMLDDGSHGMLPEDWLERYGALADLGQSEGDSLRFVPTQAALLDALLAAQDQEVEVDAQFDQLRKKLRSFDGIHATEEPSTFSGQLRHYQQEGLGWLHFLREFRFGGCLADDMGLGKTVQVLALLESRRQAKGPEGQDLGPSLVVVPRSLVFNWIEEAARFTPKLRVLDYTGVGRAGSLQQLNRYDVLVTTYGTLRRDIPKLKDVRFDYAILDESQAIKNAQSQAAKACRLIDAQHRLAMTGTPVENHLGELWSLFEFLNPGMLGRSSAFQQIHKSAITRHRAQPGTALDETGGNGQPDRGPRTARNESHDGTLDMLASALRPFILRRTKQRVLTELPEKTEQTLYCEMRGKQRKLYTELRDYYRASLTKRIEKGGIGKAKIHVLEALLRLRQAACHPGLLDAEKVDQPSAKLDALLEQITEIIDEGHKALIFSQFTSLLSIVRSRLDQRKITYEYLDGRTRRRQKNVERFQTDPACPLFLISLKAGGHGLNLTAADYVFILDPWWNPAVEAQAVDRAHRIGQTRRVFAYRLICRDTVEEKIIELQQTKRDLADAIVSAENSLIRTLTADDLQQLLS